MHRFAASIGPTSRACHGARPASADALLHLPPTARLPGTSPPVTAHAPRMVATGFTLPASRASFPGRLFSAISLTGFRALDLDDLPRAATASRACMLHGAGIRGAEPPGPAASVGIRQGQTGAAMSAGMPTGDASATYGLRGFRSKRTRSDSARITRHLARIGGFGACRPEPWRPIFYRASDAQIPDAK